MKHFLSLNILETTNTKALTIIDESSYAEGLAVDCERLTIYVPGYNNPVYIEVAQNFKVNLTACILKIQKVDCGVVQGDIPDGIYIINYSTSPNDKVFVEYNYLRITGVMNAFNKVLSNIGLTNCTPELSIEEKLKELTYIDYLIKTAKIKVEDEGKAQEGINMLAYAVKRLKKVGDVECQF